MAEELPPEPSEEEFADWLPPALALGLLSPQLGQEGAVDEIVARLLAGLIRAAGSASYHYEGNFIKDERAPIPLSWWLYAPVVKAADLFWRSGTVTFTPKNEATGVIKPLPFFGVKLEREGVYQILDASGIERPPRERPQYQRGVPAAVEIPPEPQPAPLTQQVFDTWEPVSGALQRFEGLSDQDVLDSLWARLCSGLVVAAAETAEIDGRPELRKLMLIPKVWWTQSPALKHVHHSLWKHGQGPFLYVAHSTVTRTSTTKTAQLFNVRLESNEYWKIGQPTKPLSTSRVSEDASKATQEKKPPLSEAERKKFAKLYAELFGSSGTEVKAVLAIRACYPDHFVGRDVFLVDFRAIRGEQQIGRKGKTGI
jgi:hypothetical protein